MGDIDRIIEGIFSNSLFRRRTGPIVKYAPVEELITVTCMYCHLN